MRKADIERSRRAWDRFAPDYDRIIPLADRWVFTGGREWVCSQARGAVLEVAIGSGRSLPHYPTDIELFGVELSPVMLALARRRAADLGRKISLHEADAQALPFADDAFDTVTCLLALCAIADAEKAIAEMRRVLRPGGRLLLLDHIESTWPPFRIVQRAIELGSIPAMGEHLTRRPFHLVTEAGFIVRDAHRQRAGMVECLAARKPIE